jgi:hypothetical protein
MKTFLLLSLIFASLNHPRAQDADPPPVSPSAESNAARQSAQAIPGDALAAGLLHEESANDLAAAAAAYRQAIQQFDRQRADAANAIFRLGEVYRKLGRLEEAKVQYARVLREFPDMVRLTELSHALLLGEEPKPASKGGIGVAASTGAAAAASDSSPHTAMSPEFLKRYGLVLPRQQATSQPPTTGAPVPESARAKAERIACVNNLKQLGLAALIFANDHQGAYPAAIGQMSNAISDPKILVCPSDTKRNAAASWAAFDASTQMTYEFPGASATTTEPQRVLFQCPIHGHVALGDGSVQSRRPVEQTAAPTQYVMDEQLRRRYGLAPGPQPMMSEELRQRYGLGSPEPVSAPKGQVITLTVSADGTLKCDGENCELDALTAKLSALPLMVRVRSVLVLRPEPDADAQRLMQVIEACAPLPIRISAAREARPWIVKALEKWEAELTSLQQELEGRQRLIQSLAEELAAMEPEMQQARTQLVEARQRYACLNMPAERLPAPVNQDERYRKLKAQFEDVVVRGLDEANQKIARDRIQLWLDKIYRPELESAVAAAEANYSEAVKRRQDIASQQRHERTKGTEEQTRIESLRAVHQKLSQLLVDAPDGESPTNR